MKQFLLVLAMAGLSAGLSAKDWTGPEIMSNRDSLFTQTMGGGEFHMSGLPREELTVLCGSNRFTVPAGLELYLYTNGQVRSVFLVSNTLFTTGGLTFTALALHLHTAGTMWDAAFSENGELRLAYPAAHLELVTKIGRLIAAGGFSVENGRTNAAGIGFHGNGTPADLVLAKPLDYSGIRLPAKTFVSFMPNGRLYYFVAPLPVSNGGIIWKASTWLSFDKKGNLTTNLPGEAEWRLKD